MKQTTFALSEERPSVRLVFLLWKRLKGYDDCFPSLGHLWEIIDAFSTNHKVEWSDGKFYNHLILNNESSMGWDGSEPIDILFYEACEVIKSRLTRL